MTDDFYRIRRLPPYVFAEVNAMKAAARTRGQDIVDLGMSEAPPVLAALVAGLAGFSQRCAAIARGLSLPAYNR